MFNTLETLELLKDAGDLKGVQEVIFNNYEQMSKNELKEVIYALIEVLDIKLTDNDYQNFIEEVENYL